MAYYTTSTDSNRLMFGTPGIVISGILMLAMAILSFIFVDNHASNDSLGLCLASANLWKINSVVSFLLNIGVIGAIGLGLIILNKRYNVINSHTALFTSVFFLLTGSNVWLTGGLTSSTIFALVIIISLDILFKTYGSRNATMGVFMLFSTLSFGTMIQYAFVLIIPIFLIGTMYMNVLRPKELVAALLGMICPYWIFIGFGIIDFSDFSLPRLTNLFTHIASAIDILWLMIMVGLTFIIALCLAIFNVEKVFATSSQTRAYNSFINLLGISMAWYMVFDYNNLLTYLTIFNCITGIQIAHFFGNGKIPYSYIYLLGGVCIYIALFILIINN